MPRVVPSQVRAFLEQMFPFAVEQEPGRNHTLNVGHSPMLAGLVALIDDIPRELLLLEGADHAMFVVSVSAIRDVLALWRSGSQPGFDRSLTNIPGFPPLSPVTLIRTALLKCPDEAAALDTAELTFVTDEQLRRSIRLDISESNRALVDSRWKAATVLAGAALEALLLWAIENYEERAPGALGQALTDLAAVPATAGERFRRPGDTDPASWTLQHYIPFAAHLGIIRPETIVQANQARQFRNLIHPGRTVRKGPCDRATALSAAAAVAFTVRDLAARAS